MSDAGEADPRLAAALQAWSRSATPETAAAVLAALPGARVFAAVTATRTREPGRQDRDGTGPRAGSSADMALVTLEGGAGRALPVFTSTEVLRRWRLDVRPVAVPGDQVCAAAIDQGADTLLLDLVHPVTGQTLADLAQGWVPVVGSSLASRVADVGTTAAFRTPADPAPALLRALAQALAGEPVASARLLDGPDGPVLGVVPTDPLSAAELAGLAGRLVVRLGPDLPAAGLDLTVVGPDGPGTPVPRRRRSWLRRGR